MKLKLTKAEMQAFEQVLSEYLDVVKPSTITEKLLVAILVKLYQKIAKALVVLQPKYSLKLDDVTALAIAAEFIQWQLTPADFTDNLLLKLVNKIHQHYSSSQPN